MFVGAGALFSGYAVVPLNLFTSSYSKAMDAKLAKIYYGPGGYWKGIVVIKILAEAAKVPEETAKGG